MVVALFFLVGVGADEDMSSDAAFSEDIGDGTAFSEEDVWEREPSVGQTSRRRKEPHVTDCCYLAWA